MQEPAQISSQGIFEPPSSGVYILDCDDVLLEWDVGFRRWLVAAGHLEKDPGPPTDFCMVNWLGVASSEVPKLITGFNDGDETGFGRLGPKEGALEALDTLREAGFKLRVLTKCSSLRKTIKRREENLVDVFGDVFDEIRCISPDADKTGELMRHDRSIFIDDHVKNARAGVQAGHVSVIMKASHNSADFERYADGHHRVTGWDDLIDRSPFLRPAAPPQRLGA